MPAVQAEVFATESLMNPRRYGIKKGSGFKVPVSNVYRLAESQDDFGFLVKPEDVEEVKDQTPSQRREFFRRKRIEAMEGTEHGPMHTPIVSCHEGIIIDFHDDDPEKVNYMEREEKGNMIPLNSDKEIRQYLNENSGARSKQGGEVQKYIPPVQNTNRDKAADRLLPVLIGLSVVMWAYNKKTR